ncbi:MAG: nodulation protein NfeD [Gammaproteobacteria bacterium]|nr:MAG: nodulation protein NfeD [Gammaproteobacteria bacterium]
MHAALVILRLDTPGGLDSAMREIVQAILASPIPVACLVAPPGARAASAGTYILYACHIAAMAPGTNLGAATPVAIGMPEGEKKGDAMEQKRINDAVAYIRSLAELHGRNADWAEKAVREAASLSASEALRLHVVDLLAEDIPDLLEKIHGRKVKVLGKEMTLNTRDLVVQRVEPDWRNRLLAVITDPNVAYLLLIIGIYGLIFEFAHPGFILPGVVGAICLLLSLYAFQVLPVNYAGLGLVLLGIAFMISEAFVPSFGALGLGGIIAFIIGSLLLLDTEAMGYGIHWQLIVALALTSALFFFTVFSLAIRARLRPVVTGREELLGAVGEAWEDFEREGRVWIHSELWNARTRKPLRKGEKVRVVGIEGLTLIVEPLEE